MSDQADKQVPEGQTQAKRQRQRKGRVKSTIPSTWTVSESIVINGRYVEVGTEVSIQGESGRFRFLRHVVTEAGAEWIDVIGGPAKAEKWRSFRPERVKRVHRIAKTRQGQAIREEKGK